MRTRRTERGATMVEGAIVAPLFFFLVFLIFQSAFLSRSYLSAYYGSTSGARAGAVGSDDVASDYDILAAVERAGIAGGAGDITKVVVFHATNPSEPVPPACLASAQSGLCNVYSHSDFNRPESDFGRAGWTADDYWPASQRGTDRLTGTDYIGVYVETKSGGIGGVLPQKLHHASVTRLEPGVTS